MNTFQPFQISELLNEQDTPWLADLNRRYTEELAFAQKEYEDKVSQIKLTYLRMMLESSLQDLDQVIDSIGHQKIFDDNFDDIDDTVPILHPHTQGE